jgi:hypothetical protein
MGFPGYGLSQLKPEKFRENQSKSLNLQFNHPVLSYLPPPPVSTKTKKGPRDLVQNKPNDIHASYTAFHLTQIGWVLSFFMR